jgi:hypothetical protein
MPSSDRLRITLQRATAAFRDTPGRRGRVVTLGGAAEVLVAGDLHGNLGNFSLVLQRADLARNLRRHLVLQEVIHGPHRYPDGGDKSHQLVDLVAALKCEFPARVHFLPGNHELAQALGHRIGKDNEEDLNGCFRAGVTSAYAPHDGEIYSLYRDLFAAAPLAVRTTNRVLLTHSLPGATALERFDPAALERDDTPESDLLPGGSIYSLVWGRDTRGPTAAAFLALMDADLLVSGHVPCENGFDAPNDRQLILDCAGSPAGACLFPANRPLTHEQLVGCVSTL